MEIIIHGKPNAGSSKSTSPSDTLSQKIIGDFFDRRDEITDEEALIVEARKWQGTWNSIYTYRKNKLEEISEGVGRPTYFAISIIIPKCYCCLVSEVFSLLKNMYNESIVGTYISNKGKYIVQNFDDSFAFEKLVKKIKDSYVNLEEDFDQKFIPCQEFNNTVRYSIMDCDSKAFVQTLRKVGRIVITEIEKTKDEKIANTNGYLVQNQQLQTELSDKKTEIERLHSKLKKWEDDFSKSTSTNNGKIDELNKRIKILSAEKEKLQAEKNTLCESNKAVKNKLDSIASLLGVSGVNKVPENKQPSTRKPHNTLIFGCLLVNMLLVLILIFLQIFNIKGFIAEGTSVETDNYTELQNKIESLETAINDKFGALHTLIAASKPSSTEDTIPPSNQSTSTETAMHQKDVDCGLKIVQEGRPVNIDSIDRQKPITIIKEKEPEGYAFHTANLTGENADLLNIGKPFMLLKESNNRPIIINYRSDDLTKLNEKNKLTFN